MKDAAPRIFRSLERQAGQQEFDTVVTAAVAAYGSLRHPTQRQSDDLSRLVAPLWTKVEVETRRNVAAVLSHSPRVPRAMVDLFLAAPIEVSAPFLVSSPSLTHADLARLLRSPDERIARLVDNRLRRTDPMPAPARDPDVPHAPSMESEEPSAAPSPLPTAALPDSPPLSPDFLAETPLLNTAPLPRRAAPSVDGVREALRRLALAGRAGPSASAPPLDLDTLLSLAMERDEATFYEGLGRALSLGERMVAAIVDDETGERLAVALKAMGAGSADALSIVMMLKPSVGLDVQAFDRLALFYRALKVEDCRSMVKASRLQPAPRHQPHTAPETFRAAESARREFGRRAERPLPREAKG